MSERWCDVGNGRPHTAAVYEHPPIRSLRGQSRGMSRLYGWSVEAKVADDMIYLDNDVFGDLGFHRLAIDHLDEGDALVIGLRDGYLAEYLELVGNDNAY